jgi:hypothetical protein
MTAASSSSTLPPRRSARAKASHVVPVSPQVADENVIPFRNLLQCSVREFLKRPGSDKDLLLFLGRAQWTVDQLHSEILRGAWIIAAASPELVFSPDLGSVWRVLVQQAKLREIEWNCRWPGHTHWPPESGLGSEGLEILCAARCGELGAALAGKLGPWVRIRQGARQIALQPPNHCAAVRAVRASFPAP